MQIPLDRNIKEDIRWEQLKATECSFLLIKCPKTQCSWWAACPTLTWWCQEWCLVWTSSKEKMANKRISWIKLICSSSWSTSKTWWSNSNNFWLKCRLQLQVSVWILWCKEMRNLHLDSESLKNKKGFLRAFLPQEWCHMVWCLAIKCRLNLILSSLKDHLCRNRSNPIKLLITQNQKRFKSLWELWI